MAVAMFAHFPGLTNEGYDLLMSRLDLDADPAPGAILHVAAEAEGGVNVVELWQTKEAAQAFIEQRLNPMLTSLGIRADISIEVAQLRNVFAPDLDTIGRIGAVSMPARIGGAPL
jgi:hypothetical protein